MIFFISDTHFGHTNIIQYTGRPFDNVQEMDETIIANWNRVVTDKDIVFHLGDFVLGGAQKALEYIGKLKGQIVFVTSRTHHDRLWANDKTILVENSKYAVSFGIEVLFPSRVFSGNYPVKIVACHFPFMVWEDKHYGSWHVHGHIHKPFSPAGFAKNVSVENIGYTPVSLEQLSEEFVARGWSRDWKEFDS